MGVNNAAHSLHYAHFEWRCGKVEKCLSILEAASKTPGIIDFHHIQEALNEFKTTGKFTLTPILKAIIESPYYSSRSESPTEKVTDSSRMQIDSVDAHQSRQTTSFLSNMVNLQSPMPSVPEDSMLSMQGSAISAKFSVSSPTVPRVSPPDFPMPAIASSNRIRRLGINGPPKRAILTPTPVNPSPSRESKADLMDDLETPSRKPLSALKTAATSALTVLPEKDNEDMSMTNVLDQVKGNPADPKTVAVNEDDTLQLSTTNPSTKLRAVKVNGKSYKVLQMIGKGGSSKVFRVLSSDNQIYALKKVNLRNLEESTLAGYINEINLLLTFRDNDHIINLVDYEINNNHGNLYMVMEYGETDLGKLLKKNISRNDKHLNANFIRFVWHQMLLAVQTVHAQKIVHCDLKPANFLLVGGMLKLIDFGISKAIMNDTTNIVRENQVGTVNYMSPEALHESSSTTSEKGRIKIGRPSDVWSLGCILYEMVYGKPPFAQFSLIQRLHKILDTGYEIEYPPLEDTALSDVIKGCLQRQIKSRYTIEQLLQHPFLIPTQGPPPLPIDKVTVSKIQVLQLIDRFAKHLPSLDVVGLTERIFSQWKSGSPS